MDGAAESTTINVELQLLFVQCENMIVTQYDILEYVRYDAT